MNSLLRKQAINKLDQRSYSVEQFQKQHRIPILALSNSQAQTDFAEVVS